MFLDLLNTEKGESRGSGRAGSPAAGPPGACSRAAFANSRSLGQGRQPRRGQAWHRPAHPAASVRSSWWLCAASPMLSSRSQVPFLVTWLLPENLHWHLNVGAVSLGSPVDGVWSTRLNGSDSAPGTPMSSCRQSATSWEWAGTRRRPPAGETLGGRAPRSPGECQEMCWTGITCCPHTLSKTCSRPPCPPRRTVCSPASQCPPRASLQTVVRLLGAEEACVGDSTKTSRAWFQPRAVCSAVLSSLKELLQVSGAGRCSQDLTDRSQLSAGRGLC